MNVVLALAYPSRPAMARVFQAVVPLASRAANRSVFEAAVGVTGAAVGLALGLLFGLAPGLALGLAGTFVVDATGEVLWVDALGEIDEPHATDRSSQATSRLRMPLATMMRCKAFLAGGQQAKDHDPEQCARRDHEAAKQAPVRSPRLAQPVEPAA